MARRRNIDVPHGIGRGLSEEDEAELVVMGTIREALEEYGPRALVWALTAVEQGLGELATHEGFIEHLPPELDAREVDNDEVAEMLVAIKKLRRMQGAIINDLANIDLAMRAWPLE